VAARRAISWLSHSGLLLDGADRKTRAILSHSLAAQISYVGASWRHGPDGYPRLLSLIALALADLCVAGRDEYIDQSEQLLAAEMRRQILPDGGHASRNPAVLIDLLLDLLPLRQCFAARGRALDQAILASIAAITPMLRRLRLGDGLLARFNGMGPTQRDVLATVLAYDVGQKSLSEQALPSGYVRLERGSTVVVADAGPAPPLEMAQSACAGCLSFELSAGAQALLVNAGIPPGADLHNLTIARATASHNTLYLNEQSSAKLIRTTLRDGPVAGAPIRHPDRVTAEVRSTADGVELEACHDGYAERLGLLHTRLLKLTADGRRIEGRDRLSGAGPVMRYAWDLPFAIHFHAHPDVHVRPGPTPACAELLLPSGEVWRLSAEGAQLTIEPGPYFCDSTERQQMQRIALRSFCYGEAEVSWRLERIRPGNR
jgi:uncharacterized heparinase superfamily protein